MNFITNNLGITNSVTISSCHCKRCHRNRLSLYRILNVSESPNRFEVENWNFRELQVVKLHCLLPARRCNCESRKLRKRVSIWKVEKLKKNGIQLKSVGEAALLRKGAFSNPTYIYIQPLINSSQSHQSSSRSLSTLIMAWAAPGLLPLLPLLLLVSFKIGLDSMINWNVVEGKSRSSSILVRTGNQ